MPDIKLTERELLVETFAHYTDVPDSIEDLSIEGLFDVVHTIEKMGYFFELTNNQFGHTAGFKINELQFASSTDFHEFRTDAIVDAIMLLLPN